MSWDRFFKNAKSNFNLAPLFDLLYLVILGTITAFYFAVSFDGATEITRPGTWLAIYLLFLLGLFAVWFILLGTNEASKRGILFAKIALSPLWIVVLLIPFNYYYALKTGTLPVACLTIIFAGIIIFDRTLKRGAGTPTHGPLLSAPLITVMVAYALSLGLIAAIRYFHIHNTSSFDTALYNQIQWNNIHGRFFQSSISGSNFVTHNSPFLILLAPFYAIYPHPVTLLVLKSVFLSLSVIPLCLILRKIVQPGSVFPLVLGFLFYPYIVGQNFNAPHEMCYSTPFILFTFYFFMTDKFKRFLVFLLLSLSIKEHMAMIAVMYGVYALMTKKSKRWVIVPAAIGIVWAIFSVWIIYHFQSIYNYDPSPAWLIENIKNRFVRSGMGLPENFLWGIQTSVLGNKNTLIYTYSVFSPVGLILPFLSLVVILGLPELLINLVASVPLFYVEWHYNIAIVCFVLLATVMAVKKVSVWLSRRVPGLSEALCETLLAWFLCISILSHFFLWWGLVDLRKSPEYVSAVNEAVREIPAGASVSAPKNLVAYISSRKDYFLAEDDRKGEYFLIDRGDGIKKYFHNKRDAEKYKKVFQKGKVMVYKKSEAQNGQGL